MAVCIQARINYQLTGLLSDALYTAATRGVLNDNPRVTKVYKVTLQPVNIIPNLTFFSITFSTNVPSKKTSIEIMTVVKMSFTVRFLGRFTGSFVQVSKVPSVILPTK